METEDKARKRLLNDALKIDYDQMVKFVFSELPKNKAKTFRNQLSSKLNGAYRLGLYDGKHPIKN